MLSRTRSRIIFALTLGLAGSAACTTVQQTLTLGDSGSPTTSVLGHWVLATPIDSTSFAGASQVDLVLAPGSFELTANYANRAPITVSGRADLASGGALTLVPGTDNAEAAAIGLAPGQPFTRTASAAGSTLILASPSSRVPVPSSVWYRLDAARVAGLAR
jgi:hypothetical protein